MIIFKYLWHYTAWVFVKFGLHIYFYKIKVSGKEKLPRNAPVIFGANHENAFIDALLLTTSNTFFDHYLVRASIFKNRIAKVFLNSLNLMPVYRMRDGMSSMKDNQKIFEACYQALAKKYSVMLFPEAAHNMRHIKRVAKKGISRIAIGAINYEGGIKELYLIPIGVNYTDHTGFRSSVHIVYGDPILIKGLKETKEDIDQLTADFNAVMPHNYVSFSKENFEGLNAIFFHDLDCKTVLDPIVMNEEARQIERQPENLKYILLDYNSLISGGLVFPFVRTGWIDLLIMVALLPLALVGLLVNLPILLPLQIIIKTQIKKKEFIASIKFVFGLIGFAVWWTAIGFWVYGQSEQWLLVAISLLLTLISLFSINAFVRKWKNVKQTRKLMTDPKLNAIYDSFVRKAKALRGY